MRQLHFTRTGRMHVASAGNAMFVVHETATGAITAKVFRRTRALPIDSKFCSTVAEAIDWLSRWQKEAA